jgi:hypothetical protein
MLPTATRQIIAHVVFITGILLLLLGSAFLLGTMEGASNRSVLIAFLFVIVGALCAVLAIKLNKRSLYLFFAAFLMLVGFFLFLVALKIIPVSVAECWPLLSVFAGLALLPAGWRRYGRIKPSYVAPALAFIILGCILMIFSFDVVPFSFKHFMLRWWPLLVVLTGLILVLLSLASKNRTEQHHE